MKRILASLLTVLLVLALAGCGNTEQREPSAPPELNQAPAQTDAVSTDVTSPEITPPEEFVLINGGIFQMGSPESELWRSEDETAHAVRISDFYISRYEVTQAEYQAVMGANPSFFTGDDLPVEGVSWTDAIQYCNARSTREGLIPSYVVDGQNVSWDRSANGYRLPTETEWEYACRAGTDTPFNFRTVRRAGRRQSSDCLFLLGRQHQRNCRGDPASDWGRAV